MPLSDEQLASVHAMLAEHFPHGATFRNGALEAMIEAPAVEKITDLSRLSELARAPKTLTFNLHGTMVSLELRPLDGLLAEEVDKIPDPLPPMKPVKEKGGKVTGETFDFNDPDYRRKVTQTFDLKRAAMISLALVGVEVPGKTVEEKAEALKRMFPPQVLELLRERISSLTNDAIEHASF